MTDMEKEAGIRLDFLSTEPARVHEKRLAKLVVTVSLVAFVIGIPFVRVPLARIPAFIPGYEAALLISDTITAVLLFSQFVRLRSRAILLLAVAYLFDVLIIVPHALSFPEVFSETGLMGSGPQTTAWLYVFWHAGFPLFVLAYALLVRHPADALRGEPGRAIAMAVGGLVLAVVGLISITTLGHDLLPVVIRDGDYSLLVTRGVSPAILVLTGVALLVLWYRSVPTVLDVWLMVVMLAWLLDISFSAVIGSHRYDFGFYAGRAYGVMAASFVLGALLFEMNRQYGNVANALALAETRNIELVQSREEFARLQRSEAINQLVGGVAHDFNNLLMVIMGGLDLMLKDETVTPRNRDLLTVSMKAARRGGKLTQQLLTFARRQVLRPEVLNPNEVIVGLETLISRAAGDRIKVLIHLSPVLWPARLDRTTFGAALLNLVLNARDAMNGEGSIVIETRNTVLDGNLSSDWPPGDYVLIRINDTGIGMTPEIAARAFEPFFTTKGVGKGSGLGLAQVYGFVQGASGQVRINSKPDEGTTFEMYLPKSNGHPAQVEQSRLSSVRAPRGCETILVAEDDPDELSVVAMGLLDLGYDVKTAVDAQEGLAILRGDLKIDVLFSDVVDARRDEWRSACG
jgi:signal transduction histidine kinase